MSTRAFAATKLAGGSIFKGGWVPCVCCNNEPPQSTQVEDIKIEVRCVRIKPEPEPECRSIRYIRYDI